MRYDSEKGFRILVGVVVALFALAPAAAQETFSGETEVVVVEIPVYATRDGEPVRGLTADDFAIYEGKKKREITDFEVVDLSLDHPTGVPGVPMPMSARRHILFLFDLAYAQPKSVIKARRAAIDLVRNALHPSDLAAVATYSHGSGARLVVTFTSDRDQVEAAIATLGMHELSETRADPLGVTLVAIDNTLLTRQGSRTYTGDNRAVQTPLTQQIRDQLLQDYLQTRVYANRRVDRAFEADRVSSMSRGMHDLGAVLAAVDGRKHVVYLSEGFDSSLMLGEANTLDENQNLITGQYWEVESDQMFGNADLLGDLQQMLDSFRRSDAVIHAVNIAGVVNTTTTQQAMATSLSNDGTPDLAAIGGSGRNSLLTIANGTGGSFYDSYNDLAAAMSELFAKTGLTYVLSFQPKDLKYDGAFHRIEVKLKKGLRGVRLEHRPGYYAPKPTYAHSAFERRLDTAELLLSDEDRGNMVAEVLAMPLAIPEEPAYVPVVIEVDGESLLDEEAGGRIRQLEIFTYANDGEGRFLDFFSQILELDLSRVQPLLRATKGLKFIGHLDLPPGEYTLRVLVRNSASGDYALRVRPLTVPEAGDGPLLSLPLVPEPEHRWMVVGEGETRAQRRDVAYPFVHLGDGTRFAPAVRPELATGEELPVYLLGRNLGGAEIRARVLAGDGRPLPAVAFEIQERGEHALGEQLMARLATGGLEPGSYRLEVVATDPATGRAATGALPFVIRAGGGR